MRVVIHNHRRRAGDAYGYKTRFVTEQQGTELVNLYHLARTALAYEQDRGRWARMSWAAKEFAKANPGISVTAAYKDLDGLLS